MWFDYQSTAIFVAEIRWLVIPLIVFFPVITVAVIVRSILASGQPSPVRLVALAILACVGLWMIVKGDLAFWGFWRVALTIATLACLPAVGWEAYQWNQSRQRTDET